MAISRGLLIILVQDQVYSGYLGNCRRAGISIWKLANKSCHKCEWLACQWADKHFYPQKQLKRLWRWWTGAVRKIAKEQATPWIKLHFNDLPSLLGNIQLWWATISTLLSTVQALRLTLKGYWLTLNQSYSNLLLSTSCKQNGTCMAGARTSAYIPLPLCTR